MALASTAAVRYAEPDYSSSASCSCMDGDVGTLTVTVALGPDLSNAEVTLHACSACSRHWLRYDYEGVGNDSHWALVPLDGDDIYRLQKITARALLQRKPWHFYGRGSKVVGRIRVN